MSEENIKRIEKKVDLLYKILLELNVDYVGYPYDQKYINKFMDELIPLFGLSGVEVDIDLPSFQKIMTEESKGKLETELSRLEKLYESGNFLAKDEDKIKNKISNITSYLQEWDMIVNEGIISLREEIIDKINDIHNESLFLNLRKKLGLSYKKSYNVDSLLKELDVIKGNLKAAIEKINYLGETKI